MKRPCALFLFALLATAGPAIAPAGAQTSSGDPGRAVPTEYTEAFREVIDAQIAAFARDDGAAAFAFAAPSIQRLFTTPERFMAMVRTGFQPVYRPSAVAYEAPIRVPSRGAEKESDKSSMAFAQPVRVTGPDGKPVLAMYHMEQQPDGSWRIAGVVLRALEEREG